ncbi:protein-tyrosine phosphatase [Marinobacter daqiaonensis]|uniref:protein-tyrosine-phosphatase n=1 Tax=Marinobacter daqiaonensis TaxID=650891 RepID=A0A1I6H1P4_9GAMM|nr:low molecular weight protein-tyrosine-phosphatase [Marinobacter daqiaonensis]SFR48359.1 protein-tyrosine phosphatase [Marinobacter daqiaonensis]
MNQPIRVLFVCLGNICRSPTAEGVFRERLRHHDLEEQVEVDSCGTGHWHVGKAPDERARRAAAERGVDIGHLRARQFEPEDLDSFHYVLAMDRQNLADIRDIWLQQGGTEPRLFLDFLPDRREQEVPDPYYGGDDGFAHVLDLITEASDGLLADIRARLA